MNHRNDKHQTPGERQGQAALEGAHALRHAEGGMRGCCGRHEQNGQQTMRWMSGQGHSGQRTEEGQW